MRIRYNHNVQKLQPMPVVHFRPCRRVIPCCVVLALALAGVGCSLLKPGKEPVGSQPIPLTPVIWFSPSVTTAEMPYLDSCGETRSVALADALVASVPKKLTDIFTAVTAQSQTDETIASDGVIEVGVGLRRIELAVPKQTQGTYPATATVGIEMVFLAKDGALLFNKKLEGTGRGTVTVGEQSCQIAGVEAIVQDAMDSAITGLAQQIAQSVQIREYAAQRGAEVPTAARPHASVAAPTAETATSNPTMMETAAQQLSVASAAPAVPAQLSFRAIIRDENQDQFLQSDESLTIEIEVKNEGMGEAKDVTITAEGKAELAALFPSEVQMGIIKPGEIKRTSITQRVTASQEHLHGELTLNLRTTSPVVSVPSPKIFNFGVKPRVIDAALIPDVDNMPSSLAAFDQPKAVIISIGVGTFLDGEVPAVKYARHDAEVMAEYLRIIGGVPGERIRILLDRQALVRDLEDTFEQWLRKKVDRETVVYVFFAGRALVEGGTGAISLVPYDGTLSGAKQLYSLVRLQEVLYRLPIRRAILMFDVSMDPSPGTALADIPSPAWESSVSEARKDVEMWMVGNRDLQEAHAYDEGKHGLFTYYLLRGLQGAADVDRDGTVIVGELCTYARGQAARVAREQFANKHDALCFPGIGRGGMVRIHPVARGNNPKPVPMQKQPTLPPDSSGTNPMQIGP
ncbi:MAG: hypothetical protein H8K07_13705 [Nitrospira sp.]|nr:hypothetical protein [Nitrospira sp.]MDI3467088.1 hypothetical protein [Nitrospira sp.]